MESLIIRFLTLSQRFLILGPQNGGFHFQPRIPLGAADNTDVLEGNRTILPKPEEHGHLDPLLTVAFRTGSAPLPFWVLFPVSINCNP
jgi:hypothetical protein